MTIIAYYPFLSAYENSRVRRFTWRSSLRCLLLHLHLHLHLVCICICRCIMHLPLTCSTSSASE